MKMTPTEVTEMFHSCVEQTQFRKNKSLFRCTILLTCNNLIVQIKKNVVLPGCMTVERKCVYFSEMKNAHGLILHLTKMLSEAPTQHSCYPTDSFSSCKQTKENNFRVQESKTIASVNKWEILEIKCQFNLIQIAIRRIHPYVHRTIFLPLKPHNSYC